MLKIPQKNKSKLAIGLLSGTSVDGIDAVIISISGSGKNTKLKVIDFETFRISDSVRKAILRNSQPDTAKVNEICELNSLLGKLFAQSAMKICRKNSLKTKDISFIGSHGQTIYHIPQPQRPIEFRLKSTLQIGDPSIIAALSGIYTVGDFRTADTALGGDGAPLVPYLDHILFSSGSKNRLLLNIGGIANITILPKGCRKDNVRAFDTGPGNMLIDALSSKFYGKKFDKDGRFAAKGQVNSNLMHWLKQDEYYKRVPPKSTGREHYGEKFIKSILKESAGLSKHDIIRTASEFTAFTIWYNYVKFGKFNTQLNEIIVSGGGSKNPFIIKALSGYFKGVKISEINRYGINSDNKEAVLFAVLANECLLGVSANMPSVTGAKGEVILGKICPVIC